MHAVALTDPATHTREQPQRQGRRPQVLLADDDDASRAVFAVFLRSCGFDVVECADGSEVLEHLGSVANSVRAPDVIITDVCMPGFSGMHVLAGLFRSDWHVPIIVMTGYGSPQLAADARRLGAFAVFDKPFDLDAMIAAIAEAAALSEDAVAALAP